MLNGKGKKREWRIEDDIQGGSQIMEQVGISERKAAALSGKLEESRALMDSSENPEEKSKKAIVDAARLADELRAEQDHASTQATSKQSLNNQFGQLEARRADAENAAARGGKAAMAKLENKVCFVINMTNNYPNLISRFTSWRPSLPELRHALVSQPRLTSALSARSRSSPSPPVRTRRTRTG